MVPDVVLEDGGSLGSLGDVEDGGVLDDGGVLEDGGELGDVVLGGGGLPGGRGLPGGGFPGGAGWPCGGCLGGRVVVVFWPSGPVTTTVVEVGAALPRPLRAPGSTRRPPPGVAASEVVSTWWSAPDGGSEFGGCAWVPSLPARVAIEANAVAMTRPLAASIVYPDLGDPDDGGELNTGDWLGSDMPSPWLASGGEKPSHLRRGDGLRTRRDKLPLPVNAPAEDTEM
ncbi:MAG: hypothetical protein GEU98_13170 [Pseudonocardiaceae bacterium]|nr:hypothetical protein [Pseudonocardiaceae bacterium]